MTKQKLKEAYTNWNKEILQSQQIILKYREV